jgi:hypothetical protein
MPLRRRVADEWITLGPLRRRVGTELVDITVKLRLDGANVTLSQGTATTPPTPPAFDYDTLILASDTNAAAQAKVDAASTGDVIGLERGVHPRRRLNTRSGVTLTWSGDPAGGTICSGAQPLTGPWTSSGGLYKATVPGGITQTTIQSRFTFDAGAHGQEELWFRSGTAGPSEGWQRLRRMATKAEVLTGTPRWWLDYDDSGSTVVWVGVNPASYDEAEISVEPYLLSAHADDQTVRHITARRYATPSGAAPLAESGVGTAWSVSGHMATGWMIEDCTSWGSHGCSFAVHPGLTMTRVRGVFAGQIGPCGYGTVGGSTAPVLIEDSEFAYALNIAATWLEEAGGSKFQDCRTLTIRNSWFHHNPGPRLWLDVADTGPTTIESCLIEDNEHAGILVEISGSDDEDTLVRWNTVRRNGVGSVANVGDAIGHGSEIGYRANEPGGDFGSGIDVPNSRNVLVTANRIEGNRHGWHAADNGRSPFLHGVSFQGNHVQAVVAAGDWLVKFNHEGANRIATCGADNNRYWVGSSAPVFSYNDTWSSLRNFTQWQARRSGSGLTGALDPNGALMTGAVTNPAGFTPFSGLSRYGARQVA